MESQTPQIEVEQLRTNWALALMNQGVIVRLSITRWRANAKLTHEELGIKFIDDDSENVMSKYFDLGKYLLLPPKIVAKLHKIEARARKILKEHSFDTVWGKFVPFNAFHLWEVENDKIKKEFFDAANEVIDNYPQIIQDVKSAYGHIARDVWKRLYPNSESGPTLSFIDDFVGKIVSKVPSPFDILSTFKYDATYFIIPMPSFVEESISRAESIRQKREEELERYKIAKETREKIANEYVKKKKELIDGFIESTVVSLRSYIRDLCDSVMQSINKKSRPSGLSIMERDRINEMLQKVEMLNFYDDYEIKKLMIDLGNEISKFKGEVDAESVSIKLSEIVEVTKKEFVPMDFNPAISSLEV